MADSSTEDVTRIVIEPSLWDRDLSPQLAKKAAEKLAPPTRSELVSEDGCMVWKPRRSFDMMTMSFICTNEDPPSGGLDLSYEKAVEYLKALALRADR